MAEIAQASYGYFHCVDNKFDIKDEDKIVTFEDVLDITYKNSKIIDERGFKIGKLDGDFSPLQAKRFFSRYDLLIHQPNTESGFSATLFGEKRKQTNTESKEVSYTADYGYTNYTLSIRGTEFKLEQIQDLLNDYYIGTNNDRKAA